MKFYLFLANLLFGITLLTFAVGASHFMGIILIQRLPNMPTAIKKQFRFFLLFAFISISMFLFFGKLIGLGTHSLRFTDEARSVEGLVPRLIQDQDATETVTTQKPIDLNQSITLLKPIAEIETEKNHTLGLSMQFITAEKTGFESDECSRWYRFMQDNGVRMERKVGIQSLLTSKTPAMICLSNDLNEEQLSRVEQWVFNGGQVFFAGISSRTQSDSMNKILGIDSFQSLDKDLSPSLIFGGPYLNFGAMGGLKITLGSEWANSRGFPLARVGSKINSGTAGAYLFNDGMITELSPLIFSSHGKGRAFWTSLPPVIYGKLAILKEQLWKQWPRASLNFVFDLPISGIDYRTLEKEPIKTLAIHAEYKVDQILKLIPTLKENNERASAYFVYSEADESPEIVDGWAQGGNEVGYSFFNHQPRLTTTFYETKDQLSLLSNSIKKSKLHKQSLDTNYGLMIFPGVNASTNYLGAALELNLKYVLGDPFSEQLLPYSLISAPTKELVALYPNATKINTFPAMGNHLNVLATPLGDDFGWQNQGSEAEIHAKMGAIDELYSWSGAGTVYKIHSQNLKSDAMLGAFLAALKEKKSAKWITVEDLVHRTELLNQVKVSIDQHGLQSASVVIKNFGSEPVLNPTIKVLAGQHWHLENGTQIDEKHYNSKVVTYWELELPRLNPGETKTIPLRYQ